MPTAIDIPNVHSFEDIHRLVEKKAIDEKKRAALVVPSETATLPAFLRAAKESLLDPIIIGDEQLLTANLKQAGANSTGVKIIDLNQPDLAIQTAAKMAEAGEIDLIVQGRLTPERILDGLTEDQLGFTDRGKILSHIGVLKPAKYPKLLLITDSLGHDQPDLKTKIALLGNLSRAAIAIGIPEPRTAVVTAVEAIYPQMPATTDGAVLAKMSERGQIKGVRVDGPLSFDVAIDQAAAEAKGIIDSKVAGQADAMLTSTKQVAQGIYQAMSLFGDCEVGGVLLGGRVPVAINFMSDSEDARYNSILLAILLA